MVLPGFANEQIPASQSSHPSLESRLEPMGQELEAFAQAEPHEENEVPKSEEALQQLYQRREEELTKQVALRQQMVQANQPRPVVQEVVPSEQAEIFKQEAFFAAEHGNAKFLELLLDPEQANQQIEQRRMLAQDVIELRKDREAIEARLDYLKAGIAELQIKLQPGELQRRAEARYQQTVEARLAEAQDFGQARSVIFVNGREVRATETERQRYQQDLKEKIEKEKYDHFSQETVRKIIQNRVNAAKKELEIRTREYNQKLEELRVLEDKKFEKDTLLETMRDQLRQNREKLITDIIALMNQNPGIFPERYVKALAESHRSAAALLRCASGAGISTILLRDQADNTLLHYAMRKPDVEMVNLLLKYNAISTLSFKNNDDISPHLMLAGHGNNDIMGLIQAALTRSGLVSQSSVAFLTPAKFENLKRQEVLLLDSARVKIENYKKTQLKKRQEWRLLCSERRTRELEDITKHLLEMLVIAEASQSWYIFNCIVERTLQELIDSLSRYEKSYLYDALMDITATANKSLSKVPWLITEQLQASLAARARLENEVKVLKNTLLEKDREIDALMNEKHLLQIASQDSSLRGDAINTQLQDTDVRLQDQERGLASLSAEVMHLDAEHPPLRFNSQAVTVGDGSVLQAPLQMATIMYQNPGLAPVRIAGTLVNNGTQPPQIKQSGVPL